MKKRMLAFALALLLCVGLAGTALAADLTRVSKVDEKGNVKYGFADSNGNVVIAEQYDEAEEFSYGERIVKVKKNGLWGYIDEEGKEQIPIKYAEIGYYHEDVDRVEVQSQDGLWGVVNGYGREIVKPQYEGVRILASEATQVFGTVITSGNLSDGEKWGLVGGVKDIPCTEDGDFGYDTRSIQIGENDVAVIAVTGVSSGTYGVERAKQGIWLGIKTDEVSDIIEIVSPTYSMIQLSSLGVSSASTLPGGVTYSAIVGQYNSSAKETKYGYLVDGELQKPIEYTWEEIWAIVYPESVEPNTPPSNNVNNVVSAVAVIILAIGGGVLLVKIIKLGKKPKVTSKSEMIPKAKTTFPMEGFMAPAAKSASDAAPTPKAAPASGPKFCPECGKPLTPGVKFCPECGHSLNSGEG